MKLDRNITESGRGKYALLKLRGITQLEMKDFLALNDQRVIQIASHLDFGVTRETEFFVIRLKDRYAAPALAAYAMAAFQDDPEYGLQVLNLAKAAAEYPSKRIPD